MRRLPAAFLLLGLALSALAFPASARAEPSWVSPAAAGDRLEIWLVTVGPGGDDDIPSWFGHTALWVRERGTGEERLYNYGMFGFGPTMLPQFVAGRLWFWTAETDLRQDLARYRALDRSVHAQRLDLAPERKLALARFLAWNVRPENRDYLYDHYFDNCSTRLRDAIDRATEGALHRQTAGPARYTLREHTRRHIQRNPYLDLVLNLWMSRRIDRPLAVWDEMFLPGELERDVDRATRPGAGGVSVPLVDQRVVLHASRRPGVPERPNRARYAYAAAALGLAGLAAAAGARAQATGRRPFRVLDGLVQAAFGAAFGLPGLVLALLPLTNHVIAHGNQNLLFANPVSFAMLPLGLALACGSARARRWSDAGWLFLGATTVLGLLLKLVPPLAQGNAEVIAWFGVFNLVMAGAAWSRRRKREVPSAAAPVA